MQTVKIVVFDLGGVLVRVARSWGDAARYANVTPIPAWADAMALSDFPAFEAYQAESIGWNEYAQSLRSHFDLASVEQAMRLHDGILMGPYPGTLELIVELKQAGIQVGCLSNTNAAHWPHLSDSTQYPAVAELQVPVASHQVGLGKPDPAFFRHLEQLANAKPNEILFFDDSPTHVKAGTELGWHSFLIDPRNDTAEQMRALLIEFGTLQISSTLRS